MVPKKQAEVAILISNKINQPKVTKKEIRKDRGGKEEQKQGIEEERKIKGKKGME